MELKELSTTALYKVSSISNFEDEFVVVQPVNEISLGMCHYENQSESERLSTLTQLVHAIRPYCDRDIILDLSNFKSVHSDEAPGIFVSIYTTLREKGKNLIIIGKPLQNKGFDRNLYWYLGDKESPRKCSRFGKSCEGMMFGLFSESRDWGPLYRETLEDALKIYTGGVINGRK